MKSLTRIILILPQFFLFSVAQERGCASPPVRPDAILMEWTPEKALYKCPGGYEWHGGSRLVRCSGGQWDRLTMLCRKKSCGHAGDLMNGQFQYDSDPVLGSKATAVCDDGFTLRGPQVIECGISGWPSELPTCQKGAAPTTTAAPSPATVPARVTCAAPRVPASEPGRVAHEHKVGAVLSVQCSPGFYRNGAEKITCGSDGEWTPTPPVCVPEGQHNSTCGAPDHTQGSNAHLAGKYMDVSRFTDGARVYYLCDVGHVYRGGSKYRRCDRGRWSPLQLQCKKRLCGSAGEILNGHYEYSGVEFGDRATAVCNKGFQLVGQGTRNCLSRGWDGHPPVCEALVCDDPPEVPNAVISSYGEAPFEYRTVVSYRCLVGALLGPADIWCTATGTWSSPLPQCRDITCAHPNIPNASWVRSRRGRYQYRDELSIRCDPQFSLVGPSTITCDERGQWAPELPKCKRWNMRRG